MNHRQRHQRPHLLGGEAKQAQVLREHHHKQFVERVTTGLLQPHDRFGRPLVVGDLVMWHSGLDPVLQIVEINPAPLGVQPPQGSVAVELILGVSVPMMIDVTQTADLLTKVKDAAEPAPADQAPPPDGDQETPPPDPPPAPETPTDDSPER